MRKKGFHHTMATRKKISMAHKGRPHHLHSEETRAKMRLAHQHRAPISEETRIKIRLSKIGEKNPHWGKHLTEIHKQHIADALSGEKNYKWKGGIKDAGGYEFIHMGPFYLSAHRLKMEEMLGRKLQRKETVHHINRKRKDNREENLALCSDQSAHVWAHSEEAKILLNT